MRTHERGSFCVHFCEVKGISWQLYRRSCDRSSVVMGRPGTANPEVQETRRERQQVKKHDVKETCVLMHCEVWHRKWRPCCFQRNQLFASRHGNTNFIHYRVNERGRESRLMKWWPTVSSVLYEHYLSLIQCQSSLNSFPNSKSTFTGSK